MKSSRYTGLRVTGICLLILSVLACGKPRYYVNRNAQSGGDHEVHEQGCTYAKRARNLQYLGRFGDCRDAVAEAKKYFPQADGCAYCSPYCHHS